ncbi:4-amino-4-deoxy-L-arabinose transferase [Nocardioides sp. TF02-7]|uniref:4-amino-4-deoxy-L-arabinose transferase n=1 Tax=Nocardioides sp. TF02-7 TaxID=2917724 RepID=UPI001F057A35|nr:4-amino-4-deoxy-L-arabinose transferase [Nocardioides sp. TF02-7]UMG92602.1 4-amino-4-deoxy-L-arabinose transferase [Nocardioides sp. TF02-7]
MPSEPTAGRGSPTATAQLVLDLALARAPTLGNGRLVCIDGPAGSGEDHARQGRRRPRSLAGPAGAHGRPVRRLVGAAARRRPARRAAAPARGRPARVLPSLRLGARELAETVAVAPTGLLVVEGVGSAPAELSALVTVLVWVHAPRALRRARGLARDGAAVAPYWDAWTADEDLLFATQRTAERADVVVDGTGAAAPRVRTP